MLTPFCSGTTKPVSREALFLTLKGGGGGGVLKMCKIIAKGEGGRHVVCNYC